MATRGEPQLLPPVRADYLTRRRESGSRHLAGKANHLALRTVTFPPRYRSALEPSGELRPNMARSHRGGRHDRSAERSSAFLVFGRVRYRGCDCGRNHTDLM